MRCPRASFGDLGPDHFDYLEGIRGQRRCRMAQDVPGIGVMSSIRERVQKHSWAGVCCQSSWVQPDGEPRKGRARMTSRRVCEGPLDDVGEALEDLLRPTWPDRKSRDTGDMSRADDVLWSEIEAGQLDTRTLYDVLALRSEVFVVEQACAYQDIDGLDLVDGTVHLIGRASGSIAAYARVLA